jgi:trypsin
VYVTAGTNTLDSKVRVPTMRRVQASHLVKHPKFNSINLDNDIGIIRIHMALTYNDAIRPICLPSRSSRALRPQIDWGLIAGYGGTEKGRFSPQLLETYAPVQNSSQCDEPDYPVGESRICAGFLSNSDLRGTCTGDSGGPLVFQERRNRISYWVVRGLVSYGGTKCGFKTVFADVKRYLNWIKEVREKLEFDDY